MTKMFLLAQCIGIIGILCFFLSFQIKSNTKLFIIQSVGNAAFGVQMLLLGGYSGAFNMVIFITRNMMLTKYKDWKWIRWKGWVVILCSLNLAVCLWTWDGWISIVPFIIAVAANTSMWTNNAAIIRMANMCVMSPLWIIYDIAVGAYTGIINEVLIISSVLISLYRYGWKVMMDPDSEINRK